MDKLELVKSYINDCYKARHCEYTSERSHGNYDDVFEDGSDYGKAWTLYDIGKMLGMELQEPNIDED